MRSDPPTSFLDYRGNAYGVHATPRFNNSPKEGKLEIALDLLARGANVEGRGENGQTTLYAAVSRGPGRKAERAELISVLLERGADPEAEGLRGSRPIHGAAMSKIDTGPLKTLLAIPVSLNDPDEFGATPLHIAAIHGAVEAAKLLCAAGADFEARDAQEKRPLDYAREWGWREMVDYLESADGCRAARTPSPLK